MDPYTLSPLMQRFILHFGEMGSRWGINRTVGQIYALLYVQARPLNADEVAEYLRFSRSNVSMGLKELQSWRLVKLLPETLSSLMKMGSKIKKLLDIKDKFRFSSDKAADQNQADKDAVTEAFSESPTKE